MGLSIGCIYASGHDACFVRRGSSEFDLGEFAYLCRGVGTDTHHQHLCSPAR